MNVRGCDGVDTSPCQRKPSVNKAQAIRARLCQYVSKWLGRASMACALFPAMLTPMVIADRPGIAASHPSATRRPSVSAF